MSSRVQQYSSKLPHPQYVLDLPQSTLVTARVHGKLIVFAVESEPIFRQVIRLGELLDRPAKVAQRGKGAAFLVEQINPDDPPLLVATVFAAQFIHSPLNAAVQAEIVPVNRKNFKRRHCTIKPVGEFDLDTDHAAVGWGFFDNPPPIKEAKSLPNPDAARRDIGGNAHAGKSLQCRSQEVISMLTRVPVGRYEEVIGREADGGLSSVTASPCAAALPNAFR